MELSSSSIRQLRCQMGWSQSDLAHRLGIECARVRAWEEGTEDPSADCRETLRFMLRQSEASSSELFEAPQMEALLDSTDRDCVNRRDWIKERRVRDREL